MCDEKRAQPKQLDSDLLGFFLHKPINCPELANFFLGNCCHLKKMWLIPPQHKKDAREADSSGISVLREENRLLRVHQLYTTGKKHTFVSFADNDEKGKDHWECALLESWHQTADKGWGRWRDCKRKGKRDKTLLELQRSSFFCSRHKACLCFLSVLPDHLFPG